MNSVILQIATKYVRWLLVFFAIVALFRGHNQPGGGFIGGLLVSLSVVFYSFAFDANTAKAKLKLQPEGYIAFGLLLIILSVLPGLLKGKVLMSGVWTTFDLPIFGELKLGTPFLFDIGVFLAIIGVMLMFFFSLNETGKWK
jgi:multicomponent Na+:H+ antiporter subunit B